MISSLIFQTDSLGSLHVQDESLGPMALNQRIDSVASYLVYLQKNANPVSVVALIVDDSMDSHLVILAAARIRSNFAVIDSETPEPLAVKMLQQIQAETVVNASNRDFSFLNTYGVEVSTIPTGSSDDLVPFVVDDREDSYLVVFSSGSTGNPKGVKLSWSKLETMLEIRRISNGIKEPEKSRFINLSPLSLLLGVMNLLQIFYGTSIWKINPTNQSPSSLWAEFARVRPTELFLTANLAHLLSLSALKFGRFLESVSLLSVGAGSISWDVIEKLKPFLPREAWFTTNFSATEAMRMFVYKIPLQDANGDGKVPLGQPREPNNLRLVRSEYGEFLEVFASVDIAEGYVDRELTGERFATGEDGRIWWRSGDLVELDSKTGLYYHRGRTDDFVKINDHNVSLADIDIKIKSIPYVDEVNTVSVALGGRNRIVSFVESAEPGMVTQSSILLGLRTQLPKYALPHSVKIVDRIPRTRGGKPDKSSLVEMLSQAADQENP